jgi:hypothetical protein
MPVPVVKAGLLVKAGGLLLAARRLLPFGAPGSGPGAESAGGGAIAGGSMLSAGAAKLGVTALCVAGAAGSYAVCSQVGVLPGASGKVGHHAGHHGQTAAATQVTRTIVLPAPAGRRTAPDGTPKSSHRAPAATRKPTRRRQAEFANTGASDSDAARREFGGASAANVAPTFETASVPSPASREFTYRSSAAEDEFGG